LMGKRTRRSSASERRGSGSNLGSVLAAPSGVGSEGAVRVQSPFETERSETRGRTLFLLQMLH
jgi:hypothetical protein